MQQLFVGCCIFFFQRNYESYSYLIGCRSYSNSIYRNRTD